MKHFYPAYHQPFRCIAAACPNSCCQGWDVVIDEKTESYYRTVGGAFGKKLNGAILTDADGDRVFRLREGKECPFWGEDHLCDIYRTLGEEHLCATCARFPRIRMEYADFTEHTLALACPEAARLILTTDCAYAGFGHLMPEGCEDYSARDMRFLLDVRKRAESLLTDGRTLRDRLQELLRFCRMMQDKWDIIAESGTGGGGLRSLYEELDYIDEKNRRLFADCAEVTPDLKVNEPELTRLALYFLYRYLLGAVDTRDLLSPAKFAVCAVQTVAALSQQHGMDVIRAAQLFSKEIEQSYENMERMWDVLQQTSVSDFQLLTPNS